MNLDKLKVPEFETHDIGEWELPIDDVCGELTSLKLSKRMVLALDKEGVLQQIDKFTKEIEKRNRVIEKLIEQRDDEFKSAYCKIIEERDQLKSELESERKDFCRLMNQANEQIERAVAENSALKSFIQDSIGCYDERRKEKAKALIGY